MVRIFPDEDSYIEAGGIVGSAGVYRSLNMEILVPMESLGAKKIGKRFVYEPKKNNSTLVHEITHQATHSWRGRWMPIWLREGFADYLSAAHIRDDRFDFRNMMKRCREQLHYSGKAISQWAIPDLKKLLFISHKDWIKALGNDESSNNYRSAMLITAYLFHLQGVGDGQSAKEFLYKAKTSNINKQDVEKILLSGQTVNDFGLDLQKKWKKKGFLKIDL